MTQRENKKNKENETATNHNKGGFLVTNKQKESRERVVCYKSGNQEVACEDAGHSRAIQPIYAKG